MQKTLATAWWALLVRGILAVIFAVLAVVWPDTTLFAVTIMFGVWFLVDGIFTFSGAVVYRRGEWGWMLLEGLLGIIAGIVALIAPLTTVFAMLILIAAWAVANGIMHIVQGIRLRKLIENEWMLIVSGVLSFIMAGLVVVFPGASSYAFVYVTAVFALLYGIVSILLAFRVKDIQHYLRTGQRNIGSTPA